MNVYAILLGVAICAWSTPTAADGPRLTGDVQLGGGLPIAGHLGPPSYYDDHARVGLSAFGDVGLALSDCFSIELVVGLGYLFELDAQNDDPGSVVAMATIGPKLRWLSTHRLWTSAHMGYFHLDGHQIGADVGIGYDFGIAETWDVGVFLRYALTIRGTETTQRDQHFDALLMAGVGIRFGRLTAEPANERERAIVMSPEPAIVAEQEVAAEAEVVEEDQPPAVAPEPEPEVVAEPETVPEEPAAETERAPAPERRARSERRARAPRPDRQPAPEPRPRAPRAQRTPRTPIVEPAVVTAGTHAPYVVEFAYGDAEIREQGTLELRRLARWLRSHPEAGHLRIVGHTDPRGDEAHNARLSMNRARAVRDWLVQQGFAPSRLEIEGVGAAEPVVPDATSEQDHRRNRRVEVIIAE